tara:strand:- start:1279 stop:1764 length:486 start_codon:yes stop_codon:yes gene_type:complete
MSVFVQISDFSEGRFKLATNQYNQGDLQSLIDKFEKPYILQLFGLTMGNAIYSSPTSQLAVTDPFQEEINDCLIISEGVTEMLKGLIYFEYARIKIVKSVVGGAVQSGSEQGQVKDTTSYDIYTRFNEGVDTWKAIQYKCSNDSVSYPDFNGYELKYVLPI